MLRHVRVLGVAAALALAACQPANTNSTEATTGPTDAQREAGMAAQQLAALGGPADAATRALYAGEFEATGSQEDVGAGEGAWELQLLDNYAQFNRPGLEPGGGITSARDIRAHGMRVTAGDLTITIMAQACALPNGVTLDYSVNVLFQGLAYQGCARRGGPQGPRATWASVLTELMPAIDACLGRVSARPGRVTIASQVDPDNVSVRVRESDGTRHECIVDRGGAVSQYESLSDVDHTPGESDPEFQRSEAAPAARRGQVVEEAKDAAGAHLGWFIRRAQAPPPTP